MSTVVFDIETLGFPLESFDQTSQHYLLKFADSDEKKDEVRQNLSLHALTAQVLCIALYNPDSKKGRVFYQANTSEKHFDSQLECEFIPGTEKEILSLFWEDIKPFNQFVTFNGRHFDCPFLTVRSAMLGIQPSRNLQPYRYDATTHCDLLEQFTFYQTTRRFSLDFYCKRFGIHSPKEDGVTGLDMKRLFEEQRFNEIAEYCYRDVIATAELYSIWKKYFSFA